jgi:hypothetical protein
MAGPDILAYIRLLEPDICRQPGHLPRAYIETAGASWRIIFGRRRMQGISMLT